MTKMMILKTHYTAEEAHSILTLLDELRESLWNNYHEDIIEYCHQQQIESSMLPPDIEDDIIPF